MGAVVNWFIMVLGLIALLAIILVVLAIYCYGRLVISLKSISAFPEFKLKPASVIGSLLGFITGNFISAAGGFINGVRLNGQIICFNRSLMPLYFPDIEHEVSIGGKSCLNTVHTRALWLKPGASITLPIKITLSTNDIPQVALAGLTHGGVINIEIQSRATLGPFSYLKITSITTNIPNSLSQALRAKRPAKVRPAS